MAEETQTQEPRTLEELANYFGRIYEIHRLSDTYNELVKSGAGPKQRAGVMQGLAKFVVGPGADPIDYQNELRQYIHPEAVNIRASEALATTTNEIREDYKARIDEIVDAIVSKLGKSLEGVEGKPEALEKVAYAFYPALRSAGVLRTLSKDEANSSAADRLRSRSGARTTFVDPTSNPEYEQSLQYRLIANEFLIEEKGEEGKKIYSINKGKLKDVIKENILIGSILYNAQPPKEKEAEEENETAYREAA